MDMHPTGASSPWTPTGPPTNHGFYLLGDQDFTISHIPMFMAPHAEQIFVEVSFVEQEAVRAALQQERAKGTKLFTLKSTEIVLPDIKPPDPQRNALVQFGARLYTGDFLNGGQPLIERVTVILNRVIVFDKFQAMPARLDQLTYYCFQSQGQIYLGHVATAPPDFDHILTAKVTGMAADALTQGVRIAFTGRANSADQRLKENDSLAGTAGSAKVQVDVGAELVLNTDGMKSQMADLPSPIETGMPVSSLSIEFQWHLGLDTYPNGAWLELFNKNVDLIQLDIKRALADNKMVVYLSCPISSRGGSYSISNVEIATFTAQRLTAEWGPRFWFLNPSQYQMESQHGLGLIRKHAHDIELERFKRDGTKITIDVDKLMNDQPPQGGDYLRMWTRVLAEDDPEKKDRPPRNLGGRFSAFYFLSPCDVRAFFAQDGSQNVTVGVDSYFARKFATDPLFRAYFSLPLVDEQGALSRLEPPKQIEELAKRRMEFFRYYTVKASIYYSKGSHDEWNILQKLNQLRVADVDLGIGSQIAGYFEGLQISPGAAESPISRGYATPEPPTVVPPANHTTPAAQILGEHGMNM